MSPKKDIRLGKTTIEGDLVGGDKITQIIQLPPFSPPPKLEELKAEYLAYLRRAYRALDFKGIPQFEAISSELLLEEVYVPVLARPERPGGDTWERRLAGRLLKEGQLPETAIASLEASASLPLRVEDALGKETRVVVLGDPGSGKSTLLKYLTLRLADEEDAPLPILLPLNAYARALRKKGDGSLRNYLAKYFADQGVKNLAPLFESALSAGQAVILLDGLDEVQEGRAYLVNKVESFASRAVEAGNKMVLTSRIVGYKEAPLTPKWTLYTLLDFDRPAIENFAERWCKAFEKSVLGDTPEAKKSAEKERLALLEAIDANPGVGRLASNPLLLTILALIKRQGVSLPNRRAELYELYLETLIRSWNKARALDQYAVGPELNTNEVLMTLGPLALWLREENPTAGVVSEDALLGELTRYYMGEDWGLKRGPATEKAHEFLQSVRRYSNLLVERGPRQYGFLHLTFEEMLAAYGIYQLGQLDLNESLQAIEKHLHDPGWRETILLSIGVWGLANKQPRVASKVVRAILKMNGEEKAQNILFAGACLEDVGEEGLGRAAVEAVITALEGSARDRNLPPATQRDAGFSLGRLAGSHPDFLARIRPDLDEFIPIPAGEFFYGDENKVERIDEPFAIAKYPVTNLQYRRFIKAEGYERKEFWSAEGWAWRIGEYETKADDDYYKRWLSKRPVEKRHEPYFWHDLKWNNPLAPVVGVTFFEVEAYANWLAGKINRPLRLPTELEWERVARGPATGSGSECKYPWGDDFDFNRSNSAPFWKQTIGAGYVSASSGAGTTLIGQFTEGVTPEGIADLSGNIWEWTNSWYEEEEIKRVLRGGSWDDSERFLRAVSRFGNVPDYFYNDIGFRLLSPGSVSGS